MTIEQVRARVDEESAGHLAEVNLHRITLKQALIEPRSLPLILRRVIDGRLVDERISAWLVGQEDGEGGYKIVMSEDGRQFGLASSGFPEDDALVLGGWYGSLAATFLGM